MSHLFRSSRRGVLWLAALLLIVPLLVSACGGQDATSGGTGTNSGGQASGGSASGSSNSQPVTLHGAGATFPYPLYSRWFDEYHKADGNVTINYDAIGSGGGVEQITSKTVDFGASDGPMSDDQLAKAPSAILHIPTVAGAVVVTYNLDLAQPLELDGETIAKIFAGQITKWNDPALAALNPGVQLPSEDLLVVHRSDGSGTTDIFTHYLNAVAPSIWGNNLVGKSVEWPAGVGGEGNQGVAAQVQQTPGSIGYVELAYADQNGMPYASVKNQAGKFIVPSIDATRAAMEAGLANIPADFRYFIVNQPGDNSYPIAGLTWLLVYQKQDDATKGQALVDFIKWAYANGDSFAEELLYVPLPQSLKDKVLQTVDTITW